MLKGNVGQVASQAGHLCPYLTGSPCIADALTSPLCHLHSHPTVPTSAPLDFLFSSVFFLKTTQKKKKRLSTHSLFIPPPSLADLACFFRTSLEGLTVSQSAVKVGRRRVFGAKLQKSSFTACFIPRRKKNKKQTYRDFNFSKTQMPFMLNQ